MLQFHGQLPDVLGAKFEAMIDRQVERMEPHAGKPWAAL